MTFENWLERILDLSNGVATLGVNLLVQSTLVIGGGLCAARLCRRRGAAVQSVVLRVTLVAALVCPVTSWMLSTLGLPGFRVMLPRASMPVAEAEPQVVQSSTDVRTSAVHDRSDDSLPNPINDAPWRHPGVGPLNEQLLPGEVLPPGSESPFRAAPAGDVVQEPERSEEVAIAAAGAVTGRPSALAVVYVGLAGAWMLATGLLIARLTIANLLMWRICRAARPASAALADECGAIATALNVSAPQVLVDARISSPCLVGWLRPAILIPQNLKSVGSDVLAHELAHLRRGDCLWSFLAHAAVALVPWQPLLWLVSRRLEQTADEVCDDYVVAHGNDRASYAHELVNIAERFAANWCATTAGVGIVEFESCVGRRVQRILDSSRVLSLKTGISTLVLILMVGAGATLVISVLGAGRSTLAVGADDNKPAPDDKLSEAPRQSDVVTVRGRVLDPHGKALSKAKLAVVLFSHLPNCDQRPRPPIEIWDEAESDAEGQFAMSYRKPPSDFYETRASALAVLASHDEFGVSWKYLKFGDDEATADIKLKPEQIRRGRLVNLEGRPVPGAKIHVFAIGLPAPQWQEFRRWPWHHGMPLDEPIATSVPVNGDGSAGWEEEVQFHEPPFAVAAWPRSTTTDANGGFAIRGTGREQGVNFMAYAVEQGGSTELKFDMTQEAEPKEQVFVTNEERMIEGTVTDADTDKPIVGAQVRIDATGAALFMAQWQLIADWKGRQNHLPRMYALPSMVSEFHVPPVFTETDAHGRFRVSAIRNPHGQQQFRVTVSSPDDQHYVAFQQTIDWPRREAFKQEALIKLRPGVRVRGQVVDQATGQPIARARVDFWSKELPYPFKHRAEVANLTPDGDVHPAWRKADFDGRFEVIVPRGSSYLFVNEGTDDNEVDRIDAAEVGMQDGEQPLTPQFTMVVEPHGRSTQPHRYYPDRLVKLDFGQDQQSAEISVTLRTARVQKINVVLPDGKPATDVVFYGGQEPFKEQTDGKLAPIQKTGDAQFEIAHRVEGPVSVMFFSPEHSAGAVAELARDDADDPVTISLQPLGSATARFVGADGKALADYRPLVWMSLPKKPYSGAKDLERLAQKDADGMSPLQRAFDVIWAAMLDKERHGDLKTDANGKATLPSLIPGATYRISQFKGEAKDFSVEPGAAVDLGDVVILEPDRTKELPVTKPAPAAQANVEARDQLAEAESAEDKGEPVGVSGRVVGPDGKPLAGVTILARMLGFDTGKLTTDESGRFLIRGDKAAFESAVAANPRMVASIYAIKEGLAFDWRMLLMQELPGSQLEFQLTEEVTVEGQLVSSEGKPLPDVEVTVKEMSKPKGGVDELLAILRERGSNRIVHDEVTDQFQSPQEPARTDAEGRFRLPKFGTDHVVELSFHGTGVADQRIVVVTREPPATSSEATKLPDGVHYSSFVHVVPAGRVLRGIVCDKETRKPIEGVALLCHANGKRVTTAVDGGFEFAGCVKAAEYSIDATSSGQSYFRNSVRVTDTPGLEPIEVVIEMQRGVSLRGKVTDEEGPVAGSVEYEVLYRNEFADRLGDRIGWPCASVEIQPDGSYELQVLPGPGVVAVRTSSSERADNYVIPHVDLKRLAEILGGEGVAPYQSEETLSVHRGGPGIGGFSVTGCQAVALISPANDAKELTQDLQAKSGLKLTGRVLSPDGKPLPGVMAAGLKSRFLELDRIIGNEFTAFALDRGKSRRLTFYHPEEQLGAVLQVDATTNGPIDVKLARCGSVRGRLLDETDEPLTKSLITLTRDRYRGETHWSARTDDEGRFEIGGLIPGSTYDGSTGADSPYTVIRSLVVSPGEAKDVGDVTFKQ